MNCNFIIEFLNYKIILNNIFKYNKLKIKSKQTKNNKKLTIEIKLLYISNYCIPHFI